MTWKCFAVCKNSGLSFLIILPRAQKIEEKYLTEWFYFEMTVEYFAVCNNSVLSFLIILLRAKDWVTECFYFEMTWKCFAVCNNSGLSFLIILPRAQKIEEKISDGVILLWKDLGCFAVCTEWRTSFLSLQFRGARKRSRKDRTECELIFECFAVCNNGGVSEFP